MTDHDPHRRRDTRLLERLSEGEGVLEDAATGVLRLIGAAGIRRMRVEPERLAALVSAGLVTREGARDGGVRLALTPTGRARLRRDRAGTDAFRAQHGRLEPEVAADGAARLVEREESPLAWLARRRDKDGRAYLTPSRVTAGERLRADFHLGRMMPTVTSNWSTGVRPGRGERGPGGGLADLTDRAVAARERVHAALEAVGSDLSGVLLDVCCFLKGLEAVESERRWPARSAKVVLDIALGRLAAHYGLADEAHGRDRVAIRAWGSPDVRPSGPA